MAKTRVVRALIVAAIVAVTGPGGSEASDKSAATDPVSYCKRVGTIDAPDRSYKGPVVPDWMVVTAYAPNAIKAQRRAGIDPARAIVWRCAQGAVMMCVQGNAPHCGKANTSKTPTQGMKDYCTETPNADVIPLYVIGHENPMVYDWGCRGKEPIIKSVIFKVDAQGYPTDLWEKVTH